MIDRLTTVDGKVGDALDTVIETLLPEEFYSPSCFSRIPISLVSSFEHMNPLHTELSAVRSLCHSRDGSKIP